MLGNVLFIEPDVLDKWIKERGLLVHPAVHGEPIVPEPKLNEIRAETRMLTKEVMNMFKEAGVTSDRLASVPGRGD